MEGRIFNAEDGHGKLRPKNAQVRIRCAHHPPPHLNLPPAPAVQSRLATLIPGCIRVPNSHVSVCVRCENDNQMARERSVHP